MKYTDTAGRMTDFKTKVLAVVREIPRGETFTYGEVATRAGSRGAARAVGTILKGNYDPAIPCHRVIRSNGDLGEYNRGRRQKMQKLLDEHAIPTS